jgi:hypothetical protein
MQEMLHSSNSDAQTEALVVFAFWAHQGRLEVIEEFWYLTKVAFIHTNILWWHIYEYYCNDLLL